MGAFHNTPDPGRWLYAVQPPAISHGPAQMPDRKEARMYESLSARELRGVPFVGGRRSSAIPGTDPLPATIAKDERGRLFTRPTEVISVTTETLSVHYPRRGAPLALRGTRDAGRFFQGR